ncbi:DNA-binding FrmR family transcriptional regulator [Salibacterium salarium]|uniref:Metal-sensitive transcriptional regulator n=1 Tax=Salibacterium salarium TaxID=284579 RepID=A0A428MTA6_9BACI|nr:metal-sensitive transcriptional regulator [Salibacterium salarium]MDQ0297606.1 DNA-binding FrmR family transcriptional regulator [Salibacterium salarium]RSL29363.1 metal-sensitive transcriptional regulator [Salibacterium salarium]
MEYTTEMKNRLKRVEGQVRGVQKMMNEDKDCKDVVYQLSAARSAIDRAMAYIVAENLEECIREQMENGGDTSQYVQEAIELLGKSR